MADAAGARVSGVGVQRLATLLPLPVQTPEFLNGEVHFSAHFKVRGRLPKKGDGDTADSAQVLGNIFPDLAVSPRGALGFAASDLSGCNARSHAFAQR